MLAKAARETAKASRETKRAEKAMEQANKESQDALNKAHAETAEMKYQIGVQVDRASRRMHSQDVAIQNKLETKLNDLKLKYDQLELFNQHSNSVPQPTKGVKQITDFVQQYSLSKISEEFGNPREQFFALGGIGRRRLVGSDSDTAWDFLVDTNDTHNDETENLWKQVLYQWVRDQPEIRWSAKQTRQHWIDFKEYAASGDDPNIHGKVPRGFAGLLKPYMTMVGKHETFRSKLIAEDSELVTNVTAEERLALGFSMTSLASSEKRVREMGYDLGFAMTRVHGGQALRYMAWSL